MTSVSLNQIRKAYGNVEVLHGVSLEITSGEFVVFVGPSGCGKSTMLRAIAGLEEITDGILRIGGKVVNDIEPSKRGIAMVFQSYALYPHMTVFENMAFGLKLAGLGKDVVKSKVNKAVELLQLTPYIDRLPRNLSGGQRQRVAIGRAITRDPKVFLFDEPLSNLDAALRVATRIEITNLKEALPETTMIYVTHDQVEAMTLADRIVVFNSGRIEQVGTPLELYHRPQNLFVARFIGSPVMNIIKTRSDDDQSLFIEHSGRPVSVASKFELSALDRRKIKYIGIRPEHVAISETTDADVMGTIKLVEELGEYTIVYVDIGAPDLFIAKLLNSMSLRKGEPIKLNFLTEAVHFFDQDTHRVKHIRLEPKRFLAARQ